MWPVFCGTLANLFRNPGSVGAESTTVDSGFFDQLSVFVWPAVSKQSGQFLNVYSVNLSGQGLWPMPQADLLMGGEVTIHGVDKLPFSPNLRP